MSWSQNKKILYARWKVNHRTTRGKTHIFCHFPSSSIITVVIRSACEEIWTRNLPLELQSLKFSKTLNKKPLHCSYCSMLMISDFFIALLFICRGIFRWKVIRELLVFSWFPLFYLGRLLWLKRLEFQHVSEPPFSVKVSAVQWVASILIQLLTDVALL